MAPVTGLSLEGRVVAVAADRGHHFSKPPRNHILLVEGHGVEGDAHAGTFVRHRYLARREPRLPNLRQVHLIRSELYTSLLEAGFDVLLVTADPLFLGRRVEVAALRPATRYL
jgi:hypothetical protein